MHLSPLFAHDYPLCLPKLSTDRHTGDIICADKVSICLDRRSTVAVTEDLLHTQHTASVPLPRQRIGGTFSSRVSEQCLSACRCTMARLTVPERACEFGGGWPNIAVSTFLCSTPPGLCPTSPIFCYAKSRGGLLAHTLTNAINTVTFAWQTKCLKCSPALIGNHEVLTCERAVRDSP